jgi:hypothetical protein
MLVRTLLLRSAAVVAVGLSVAGCAGSSGSSSSGSSNASDAASTGAETQALPKVTPPATPPTLPPGFPVGSFKNDKASVAFDPNGTVKVTIGEKSGTALYTVSDKLITFQGDDGGLCDSPATYSYALSGGQLKLIQTTVDLCDDRSRSFTAAPFAKG